MTYSFIQPKPKAIFKRVTKIWCAYTFLAVVCIVGFAEVVKFQTSQKLAEYAKTQESIQETRLKSIVVKDYIERLSYEIKVAERVQAQNQGLRDALANLFNLIPDQITVRSMELEYNMLVMRGLTPSREVYKFLLEAPLRAIFTHTRVEFYPLASGWFNFVSFSKTTPVPKPKAQDDGELDNE